MIPYGLSLGAAAFVGQSLGKNRPIESQANFKMIQGIGLISSFFTCTLMIILRDPIVRIYSENEEVATAAAAALCAFSISLFFEFAQC
jgi:multidrug resistance protein, MATE family